MITVRFDLERCFNLMTDTDRQTDRQTSVLVKSALQTKNVIVPVYISEKSEKIFKKQGLIDLDESLINLLILEDDQNNSHYCYIRYMLCSDCFFALFFLFVVTSKDCAVADNPSDMFVHIVYRGFGLMQMERKDFRNMSFIARRKIQQESNVQQILQYTSHRQST